MLQQIRDETMAQVSLFAPIVPMTIGDGAGIAIRPTPTTDINFRLDNGRTYVLGLQVFIRSASWSEAWEDLHKIHDLWIEDGLVLDGLSNITCSTNPNFVGRSENKQYEFTAIYQFDYERG